MFTILSTILTSMVFWTARTDALYIIGVPECLMNKIINRAMIILEIGKNIN